MQYTAAAWDERQERPRQITVARPGALGDTLLTLPALALLRQWAPDAQLTFIARAETLPLARVNGLADRVWPWDLPDWGALFATETNAPPRLTDRARHALCDADAVIVWSVDPEGAIARRLGALGVRQALVVSPLAPEGATHAAVWLAETLRPLGVGVAPATREELTRLVAPLRAPAEDVARADVCWRDLGMPQRVVALHPGSGSQAKRWPAERFAEVGQLARDDGYAPLLLAGEADALALAETQAALARLGVVAPVARGLSVATLAALLGRCAGYVGCDSGISHLAGLVGAPTVAVFGPTTPARWSPLGPHVSALQAPQGRLGLLDATTAWAALRALLPASDGRHGGH